MFYEKDEINELLKCPNCNERLEEPCMLPCGHTVCARCTSSEYWFVLPSSVDADADDEESDSQRSTHQLVCNACLEVHRIPAAGFPTNKVLLKLVETKPHDVYRGKAVERLKTSLRAIRARKIDLLALLDADKPDSRERIREHCGSARAAVQLASEQLVARIDECLERRMHEIDRAFAEISHATEHEQVVASLRERIDNLVAVSSCAEKEERSDLDEEERVAEEANAIRDELDRLRDTLDAQRNSALALHFVESSPTICSNSEILGKLTIGSESKAKAEQKRPLAVDKTMQHATTKVTRRPLVTAVATTAKRQDSRVEPPTIKEKQALPASLSVDFDCMEKFELSSVFGTSTQFMRIICSRAVQTPPTTTTTTSSRFVAFYHKRSNVYLSVYNKPIGRIVWSENDNVVLRAADCFTCTYLCEILVYLNMPSKGKASLKLYDAHLRILSSSTTFEHRAVSVAMNARALFVATNVKQIVTFNKRLVETADADKCTWPSEIEHIGATDQLVFVVDVTRHVTTLACADLKQQMRVFSIDTCSDVLKAPTTSFHIHSNKYLLFYSASLRDKLVVYDFEGNRSERRLQNVPPNASLVLAGHDLHQRLVFVDSASSTLYYY